MDSQEPFLGGERERPALGRAHALVRRVLVPAAALVAAFCAGALWADGSGGGSRAWSRLAYAVRAVEGPHMPTAERFRNNLVFSDDFDDFDLRKWKHEITMSAGGNWEFQVRRCRRRRRRRRRAAPRLRAAEARPPPPLALLRARRLAVVH